MQGVEVVRRYVGAALGQHLPEKAIEYGAATLFALFGDLLIAEWAD